MGFTRQGARNGNETWPPGQNALAVVVCGLSYEEAAESAGKSIGTIKSRLSRARGRVRDHLKEHRELLPDEFRHV